METKCKLLQMMLSGLIRLTMQSIAGVTYMDRFDFEQRYRNVHECNPFHWYPLHLPPYCTKMYEEVIEKGITFLTNSPVRIMTEKEDILYNLNPSLSYSSLPFYGTENSQKSYEMPFFTPYMKMLQMLRKDVNKEPSAPVITNMPGLGAVALYNQPISKKSGRYIKKIAGIYRDANMKYNEQYENENECNTNCTANSDKGKNIKKKEINQQEIQRKLDKRKLEHGNIIAYLRTIQNFK